MVSASEKLLQLTNIKRIVCSTQLEKASMIFKQEINGFNPGENGLCITFDDFIFISDLEVICTF